MFQLHDDRQSSFLTANKLDNIVRLAAPLMSVETNQFDSHPMQMCVSNGVVDLNTGVLLAPSPDMYHSKMADVQFDSDAGCPHFRSFVNDVFDGDAELVEYVQKAAGYTMTGSIDEQVMFMLLGNGANGKSTFVNILTDLMGDYAVNTAAHTLMADGMSRIGDDLVRLSGARLITTAETEHGQRFAEARIKSMTGGDTITARQLYGRYVSFKPVGKIWLTTNNRPIISGSDDGIWRRLHEVPFKRQFKSEEQDKDLTNKLLAEKSGIFNWLIEGCLKWQREGLNPPASVTSAMSEYRNEMDSITAFIEDQCIDGSVSKIKIAELTYIYNQWCEENDAIPQPKGRLKSALEAKGYKQTRTGLERFWQGFTLQSVMGPV